MRRRSAKTAALYRTHGPMRRAFVEEMGRCANCGATASLSAHEMTPGANRLRAFGRRECLLAACSQCNCDAFKDASEWPLERQLFLKLQSDPAFFDLTVINEVLAPEGHPDPPLRVSPAGVLNAARKHLMEDGWPRT